jgi:hypothetical protein
MKALNNYKSLKMVNSIANYIVENQCASLEIALALSSKAANYIDFYSRGNL